MSSFFEVREAPRKHFAALLVTVILLRRRGPRITRMDANENQPLCFFSEIRVYSRYSRAFPPQIASRYGKWRSNVAEDHLF
jgi:hypothetical protein